jgi:dihydrodipicolinate synthase/N-acetylneuraminate lyase
LYVMSASPFASTASRTFFTFVFDSGSLAVAGDAASSIATMPRTIAAALTPLRADGNELDVDAFEPYLTFLQRAGVDGVLALGTTGEGIAFNPDERKRALETFVTGPLPVIAHCGAQTTASTVALAEHAASLGVEGVAVIAPPYFPLDDDALLAHFEAAARACAPTPFYAYELRAASGYAIPPAVVERLRDRVDNVRGMKVSDAPFAAVEPYLFEGLDVFIGAEALIGEGLAAGAAGAVSGLAAAFPDVVVAAVESGDSTAAGELRAQVDRFPRHAALKEVVRAKGVPLEPDVRAPLRRLTDAERSELLAAVL